MFSRIRKAIIAGVGAGIAALVGGIVQQGNLDQSVVVSALGAAIVIGYGTWRVPNEPELKEIEPPNNYKV